jgi:hypothetical protein
MPFWLILFLVVVTALLLRELYLLLGQRTGRVLDLTPAAERVQRRIVGLRLLAFVSLALALGQRKAYELGWHYQLVDALTALFLVIAVALILAAWYLRRKHGM